MALSASTLTPTEVAQYFVDAGIAKHRTRTDILFFKAFLAGIYLSFGNLLSEVLSGGSPSLNTSNPGLVKILGGFVFPVGLVMIVLNGQELLTSNMLVFPMCAMKRAIPWWGLPYNWLVVFWGNLVGSMFFGALLVKYSGIMSADPYHSYIKTAAIAKAVTPEWHQIFLRGIGCNWLVSVAVWQGAAGKEVISKIFAIWIPIWIFVACSFDHVVANMYSIPLAIMMGADITVAEYIRKSLIASFIGNVVGALLLAVPYTYFYLSDDGAGGLKAAEAGEAMPRLGQSSPGESLTGTVDAKREA